MTKTILKAVLWGVVSWLALSVLLFFGVGFYQGLVGTESELPPAVTAGLRYFVLLLSLGVAALIFIREEKKQKPFKHIVAEEKPELKKEPAETPSPKKPEFHGVVMPRAPSRDSERADIHGKQPAPDKPSFSPAPPASLQPTPPFQSKPAPVEPPKPSGTPSYTPTPPSPSTPPPRPHDMTSPPSKAPAEEKPVFKPKPDFAPKPFEPKPSVPPTSPAPKPTASPSISQPPSKPPVPPPPPSKPEPKSEPAKISPENLGGQAASKSEPPKPQPTPQPPPWNRP